MFNHLSFVLQKEYDRLEAECKEVQNHFDFVSKAIADVKRGKRFTLFPRPQIVDAENTIHVFGVCVACGEALEASYVVGSFMLSCRHQYHPLCFSVLLQSSTSCVKPGCNTAIPVEAKAWISGHSTLKSTWAVFLHEINLLC